MSVTIQMLIQLILLLGHYTEYEDKACLDAAFQTPKTSILMRECNELVQHRRHCPHFEHVSPIQTVHSDITLKPAQCTRIISTNHTIFSSCSYNELISAIFSALPFKSRECPLSGHYFLSWNDSGCAVELRSGCSRPDVIDIVSSCSTQQGICLITLAVINVYPLIVVLVLVILQIKTNASPSKLFIVTFLTPY